MMYKVDSPVFKNKTLTKTAVGLDFQPLITGAMSRSSECASLFGEFEQLLLHVLHEGWEVLVHEAEADEGPQLPGAPGRVLQRRGQLRLLPQHRLRMEGWDTTPQPRPSSPWGGGSTELPGFDALGIPPVSCDFCL